MVAAWVQFSRRCSEIGVHGSATASTHFGLTEGAVIIIRSAYTSGWHKGGTFCGHIKGVGHVCCLCAARPFVHLRIGQGFMGISGVLWVGEWAGYVCTGARETGAERAAASGMI